MVSLKRHEDRNLPLKTSWDGFRQLCIIVIQRGVRKGFSPWGKVWNYTAPSRPDRLISLTLACQSLAKSSPEWPFCSVCEKQSSRGASSRRSSPSSQRSCCQGQEEEESCQKERGKHTLGTVSYLYQIFNLTYRRRQFLARHLREQHHDLIWDPGLFDIGHICQWQWHNPVHIFQAAQDAKSRKAATAEQSEEDKPAAVTPELAVELSGGTAPRSGFSYLSSGQDMVTFNLAKNSIQHESESSFASSGNVKSLQAPCKLWAFISISKYAVYSILFISFTTEGIHYQGCLKDYVPA